MVKITKEMEDVMNGVKIFYLATASKDGIPNVAPMGMVYLQDDKETVWFIDNYMNKTLANVRENPVASVAVWTPEGKGAFQFKGTVTIENEGDDYENAVTIAHFKSEKYPAKNLLKMRITEIYTSAPGPEAGNRLF